MAVAMILTRENVQTKGRRYVTEGRLKVVSIGKDRIDAVCRGNGHEYRVGWQDGWWLCSCEARSTCCHLIALQLVVVAP